MSETRYMPMPVPHPIYNGGGYPVMLKVSFRNGKVRSYIPKSEILIQPIPHVISTMELNRLFRENPEGYQPKHAKK